MTKRQDKPGSRLSKNQRRILADYHRRYTERGVEGLWRDYAIAVQTALNEIDRLKRQVKRLKAAS